MEDPILKTYALGGANAGSLLGHLAFDKTGGGEDDFAYMPPLEDASDHDRSSPRQMLFTPTSDTIKVLESGMVRNSPVVMEAKGLESQIVVDLVTTPTHGPHVEVSAFVVVPSMLRHTSPRKAKSFGDAKNTSYDSYSWLSCGGLCYCGYTICVASYLSSKGQITWGSTTPR